MARSVSVGESEAQPGPSPWVPATILEVILVIAVMPYMSRTSEPTTTIAAVAANYQLVVPRTSTTSPGSFFTLSFLWIPVLLVVLLQWLAGSWPELFQLHAYYNGGPAEVSSRSSHGGPAAPAAAYQSQGGQSNWLWSGFARIWNAYNGRKNDTVTNWLWTTFVDFDGHWYLFFPGILLFSILLGSRTAYTPPPYTPAPTFRFPWSLFVPRRPARY